MQAKKSILVLLVLCVIVFGGSYLPESNGDENFVSIELSYKGCVWKWSDSDNPKTNIFTNYAKANKNKRLGTNVERSDLIKRIHKIGFSYEDAFDYTFFGIRELINDMCKVIEKEMVNASVEFKPNSPPYFFYGSEQIGLKVDKEKLYQNILSSLKQTAKVRVEVLPEKLLPTVTKEELKNRTQLKSRFETYYASSPENRKSNIELAVKKFNGLIMMQDEECSFNKTTGRRTEQNGYKQANIIVNNEYTQSLGGGVCQVSTTIYNALLLAGVEVLESHPHSLASGYVMSGFDAMVNFGSSDLRWKNTTGEPIYIRTYANGETLGVEIYGIKNNFQIKRNSQVLKTILPPEEKVIEDSEKYKDEVEYKTRPKNGSVVKSYLEFYNGENFVKRKLLRTQTYKPMQGVKIVGTKEKEPEFFGQPFYEEFNQEIFENM
mgnify:CR=1 FL=1